MALRIRRWTRLRAHTPASANPHTNAQESVRGYSHASGLLIPSNSTSYPLLWTRYRALQGAAQGRATISLLVNKSISYNPPHPPLRLDRPAQPRRGCFVREGGECQSTWAPLQSTERGRMRVVGLHSMNLVSYRGYFRSHCVMREISKIAFSDVM